MAKTTKLCKVCECLQGPDVTASLGFSESKIYGAHLVYLISAINYWMHAHGYESGNGKNPDIPIEDAQLVDALSEIIEYRLEEGGDRKSLTTWQTRKMINFWRRTGRRVSEEPFALPNLMDIVDDA